ncbi:MAG: hypothetical protein HYR90_03795 [Candidatus Andersenbacteria bacterium]|nr:hypothetical protein [Candidatus Andersenbacteria bacterium]MBI3250385.1 hypothetical protein [Candidatus Andersenbacteria bacterium]
MLTKRFPALSHPLLLSIFFFAGLEVAFALQRLVIPVMLTLVGIVIAGIAFIRYEELGRFKPYQMILPGIAVAALTAFTLFLPVNAWLHVYMLFAAACLYLVLTLGAKQAYPTWNLIISLIILLIALASILGSRFHLYVPVVLALGLAFAITTLIVAQTMVRYRESSPEAWLLSCVMGFTAAQLLWVLQFLPLHFMVQSGVILAVLYVGTGLAAAQAEGALTKKVVLQHIGLSITAVATLLLTARWQ